MYEIRFDRSFLQLSNGIRHVMPSTDRKLELTAKSSMAQPVSQPAVCSNGLMNCIAHSSIFVLFPSLRPAIRNITASRIIMGGPYGRHGKD